MEYAKFTPVTGIIVDMITERHSEEMLQGCLLYFTVEDDNGNITNFMVTPRTFVLDFQPLQIGTRCTFWYRTDGPAVLIFPPQYTAVAAATEQPGRMVDVSYYDQNLVNAERTMQLKLDEYVEVRTVNNQVFLGNPGEKDLLVTYENTTRSIPAQTTPRQVYVLCEDF